MRIICWLQTIWFTIISPQFWQGGYPIDGCDFKEIENHKNVEVQVLKCKRCGKISMGWHK